MEKIISIIAFAILFSIQAFAADWLQGSIDVTTAGTGQVLVADQSVQACVTIKAKNANTGDIYLSNTKARSETANQRIVLASSEVFSICVPNLSYVWVNSTVSGEGVQYAVEIR